MILKPIRLFLSALSAAAIAIPFGANAAVVSDLLVYYNFDGQTNDQTGNAAAATLNGTASLTGTGYLGSAGGALDTSASITMDAAVVPAGTHLDDAFNNNSMAVSFWQFNIANQNSSAFWIHSPSVAGERGFQAHTPWGNGTIFFDQAGCCANPQRVTTSGSSNGVWQHLVFQRDAAGVREIWIDGVQAALSHGDPAAALAAFNGVITIGAEGNTLNNSFNGQIDEFAIWSTPLSSADIQALAAGGSTTSILVPEPSSALLGLFGAGLLFFRRRR